MVLAYLFKNILPCEFLYNGTIPFADSEDGTRYGVGLNRTDSGAGEHIPVGLIYMISDAILFSFH